MKNIFLLCCSMFFLQAFAYGFGKEKSYTEYWEKVQKLEEKSLPKSVIDLVDEIYEKAEKEGNSQEKIKALIYKFKQVQKIEEESDYKIITELEDEILEAQSPEKEILHSLLGQIYWDYYEKNRYTIMNRTQVKDSGDSDLRTWDLSKLVDRIIFHYIQSLKNTETLKNIKVEDYGILILGGDSEGIKSRGSLYDIVMHKALDFFMNNEASITKPIDTFEINKKAYFGDSSYFIKEKLVTNDDFSFKYYVMKILQDLEKNYKNNEEVLLDIILKRLGYVRENSVFPDSDSFYEEALEKLAEDYSETDRIGQIKYSLASFYRDLYLYGHNREKYEDYNLKAHKILEDIIRNNANSKFFYNADNLRRKIEESNLNLLGEKVIIPKKSFPLKVEYRNVNKIYWKLLKFDKEIYEKRYISNEELVEAFSKKDEIQSGSRDVKNDGLYVERDTELILEGLACGEYVLIISDNENFDMDSAKGAYIKFDVSNLSYLSRTESGQIQYRIFNRTTGKKYPNVEVRVYEEVYSKIKGRYVRKEVDKFISDEEGFFTLKKEEYEGNSFILRFITEEEDIYIDREAYISYYGSSQYKENTRTFYFTDRAIYRPGQTVYFKGMTFAFDGDYKEKIRVVPNELVMVEFFDRNYKSIDRLSLKTNKYGTVSGSFIIPDNVLTGTMRIRGGSGERYFYVEEYKRPNFYIEFDKAKTAYKLNDEIMVEGEAKAYSGYEIGDAEVNYSIERKSFSPVFTYWNWIIPESKTTQIANGILKTDKEGKFKIKFDAIPDLSVKNKYFNGFEYVIHVDITDISGETRSFSKTIRISDKAVFFDIILPEAIDKDNGNYKAFYALKNIEGQFVDGEGKIKVYSLKEPDKIIKDRLWNWIDYPIFSKDEYHKKLAGFSYENEEDYSNWPEDKKILEETFDTKKSKNIVFTKLGKLPAGKYKIEFQGESSGEIFEGDKYFTLYSKKDTELPYKMPFWFNVINSKGEPGQKAEILVGTSYKDALMMYQIENKGKVVKEEFINFDEEQKLIEIPITEENRGGFYISFYLFRDNRIYRRVQRVEVPWTNKKLNIKLEKFRNTLEPGENEKWTFRIENFENKGIEGELALALYDASLDSIMNHSWDLNLYPRISSRMTWDIDNSYGYKSGGIAGKNLFYYSEYRISYPYLNNFDFDINYHYYSYTRQSLKWGYMTEAVNFEADALMENRASAEKKSVEKEKKKEDDIRENFNETAFFYPQLVSNKDGKVEVEFTMPDSLTKWKLLAMAVKEDTSIGLMEEFVVTAKDLMVRANAPRFLREGDEIEFSAEIINGENKDIKGAVELELLDSVTMENIAYLFGDFEKQEFEVEGNSRKILSWKLKVPFEKDSVVYRLKASSGNMSDGEQKLLPILKNRMLVTETLPISLRGNEYKKFDFESLKNNDSKTLKNYRYTFEFTGNPAWYIVEALPYLMESPYENNESIFSRYYSNLIGKNIIDSSPEIERIFKKWKMKKSSELLSNLEKNQELKSIVLENTPWLRDAKDESERKQRLALYFDSNKIKNELKKEKEKLIKNQKFDGSWPWFDGMKGNRYITQYIVIGFARLHNLGIINIEEDKELMSSIKKAVDYLDSQIKDDYDRLVQNKFDLKENNLGYVTIGYLYARSYLDFIPLGNKYQKAADYYKNQLVKYRHDYSSNKYIEGMTALTLFRMDKKEEALEVMDSIREYAIYSEETGMYWKGDEGLYWYQDQIASQTILIEAFDEILEDEGAVEEMKLWLLKQKQTQNWSTSKSTAEACYAFLLRGKNMLSEGELPGVVVGGEKLDIEIMDDVEVEDGTQYFKLNWNKEQINKELAQVEIKNNNDGAAWGGLYWQYFEDLDKIKGHESNLKLYKKLFVEKTGSRGAYIEELKEGSILKVGDKVKVRIEIRVDRDMEYVHLKDMRASSLEPENTISSYRWQDGLGYYEAVTDSAVNFFMDYLPKGTYIFEYPLRVTHMGEFSNGITTIQSMYAPEFSSHSEGIRVEVK